jgi:hypothetical protein
LTRLGIDRSSGSRCGGSLFEYAGKEA